MKLLFLDIDGVLNDHSWDKEVMSGKLDRDKVILLNMILRDTGAKLVLSSAWRYLIHRGDMTLMGFEWLLRSHGVLADRLIGITVSDEVLPTRGLQITQALKGRVVDSYVVLDDLALDIREQGHPLVQTNGNIGLTYQDAAKAIEILRVIS